METTDTTSNCQTKFDTSQLDPIQLKVTQKAATEKSFSGKFWNHWELGTYTCVVCNSSLFK